MRAREFITVNCVDCHQPVPAVSSRMRRCWDCIVKARRARYLELLEINEKEIARI